MKKVTSLFGILLLTSAMFVSASGPVSAATRAPRVDVQGGQQGKFNLYAMDASATNPRPIAGAAVAIFNLSGQAVPVTSARDVTDGNGLYTTMLTPGEYTVKVRANGYDGQAESATIVPAEATNVYAFLSPVAPVPASVPPGPSPCASCDPTGKFVLYVFDASTTPAAAPKPVAGASVTIYDASGSLVSTATNATGEDGYFSTLLDEGVYTLKVWATGYDGYSIDFKISAEQSNNLNVALNPVTPEPAPEPMPMPAPNPEPVPAHCFSCPVDL